MCLSVVKVSNICLNLSWPTRKWKVFFKFLWQILRIKLSLCNKTFFIAVTFPWWYKLACSSLAKASTLVLFFLGLHKMCKIVFTFIWQTPRINWACVINLLFHKFFPWQSKLVCLSLSHVSMHVLFYINSIG